MKYIIVKNTNIYKYMYHQITDCSDYRKKSQGSCFHQGPPRDTFEKKIDIEKVSNIKTKKKLNE